MDQLWDPSVLAVRRILEQLRAVASCLVKTQCLVLTINISSRNGEGGEQDTRSFVLDLS